MRTKLAVIAAKDKCIVRIESQREREREEDRQTDRQTDEETYAQKLSRNASPHHHYLCRPARSHFTSSTGCSARRAHLSTGSHDPPLRRGVGGSGHVTSDRSVVRQRSWSDAPHGRWRPWLAANTPAAPAPAHGSRLICIQLCREAA